MINTRLNSRRRWRLPTVSRRGMTVIVVLGVISITLALSYAMMRSQVTSVEIQSNLERRNLARQAAYAGISAGLQKMHGASWGGVESTLNKSLATQQWYEVSYTTGDTSLTSTSADYSELPFRVTIHATGYAADPTQPDMQSSYRVSAVVELVRKKLQAVPATWEAVKLFTVVQYSGNTGSYEVPLRIEGPMWVQGKMDIGSDYPKDPASNSTYYSDLTAMKNTNQGDYRPFSGPIYTPLSKQPSGTRTFLTTGQQVTLTDVSVSTAAPVTYPTTTALSYQLFPGGKSYVVPTLQATYGTTLTGVTLAPNPATNPLGIYLSSGTLFLNTNTNITGTIVTTGSEPDVRIVGKNVTLQAATMPKLSGSTVAYQLPAAIIKDDFQLVNDATCNIRGLILASDEFTFERGPSTASCILQGRVVCSKLLLYGRIPWDLTAVQWAAELTLYNVQKLLLGGIRYFPQWMKAKYSFEPNPLLVIKPDPTAPVHHWHTFGQPVYTYGDGDTGLRWNLIDWTDNASVAN
jgi:hypothetical protein